MSQTAVLVLLGGLIGEDCNFETDSDWIFDLTGVYVLLHTVPGAHTESVLQLEK